MFYVPATSWCATASNKSLLLAVVSIIRYPGKHDSASQESLLSLFGPPSLLANDKYFNFFTLPKIRGAPGAPPLGSATEFCQGTGFDNVGHHLGLATRTQISVCKSPFPSAGTTVSLFRTKTVQQRPLLPREVETWLPDCGVTH